MSGANENYSTSGPGSPGTVASDATPVTNNKVVTTKKRSTKNSLHSLWEYRATSLTGKDDRDSSTNITTGAVSPDASPDDENKSGKNDAVHKKPLIASEGEKLVSTSSSSLHENVQQPRKSVKEEAKKFEVGKKKSEDELTLLKKELGKLQGEEEVEPEKDAPRQAVQEKKTFQFWQQKSNNTSPAAKNESTSFNKAVSTKSSGGDFVVADALAGTVTVAATATAATEVTQAAANAKEGSIPSESKSIDNSSITSGDSAQLMSEFRALIEKLVHKGKLLQLSFVPCQSLLYMYSTNSRSFEFAVMPSEVDHIDELIGEYNGREEELLEILSAMQVEIDQGKASPVKGNAATVAATSGAATVVATASAVNSPQDTELGDVASFESDMHVYEDDETSPSFETIDQTKDHGDIASVKSDDTVPASNKSVSANLVKDFDDKNDGKNDDYADADTSDVDTSTSKEEWESVMTRSTADIGVVVVPSPDRKFSDVEEGEAEVAEAALSKSDRESCCKRNKRGLIALAIILVLGGAGAAAGIILSSRTSKENNDKNVVFEEPIGTGRPLPESEGALSPGIAPDDIDTTPPTVDEDLSTFCTSESSYSKLPLQPGIGQLKAKNPLVAVDGELAVIASGGGYVSFYSLQGATWQRGETFGILAAHGDIASVSISGDTAVIGLPKAAIAVGPSGPVATGMIVTYERNPESGKWRQSKELVPDEYQEGALRYRGSEFGKSVSIYDDLVVVGAPFEDANRGSVTAFKKDEKGSWKQVISFARGAGTCQNADKIHLGYFVEVYQNTIAASADCAENIVLYEYDRTDSIVKSLQVLDWVDKKFGAVASIGMNGEYLIYSTVKGGLFIFRRQGDSEFALSQNLTFNDKIGLFEYPVAISGNLFALAVVNNFLIYTQAEEGAQWKREPVTLASDGDFTAYVKAGLAVSNGNVFLGSDANIEAYDFSQCVPEVVIPEVVFPETNCLVVNVTLDKYPSDTSWSIEDSEGNLVANSSLYDDSMATTTQVEEVCDLSDGTYTFAIFDVYEDGICCDWSEGSYTLSTEDGLTIASGGEFGASEMTPFSIPFASDDSTVTKPPPTNLPTPPPTKQPSLNPTTTRPTPTPSDAPSTSEPTTVPSTSESTSVPTDNSTIVPITSKPTEKPTLVPATQAPVQPCIAIEVSVTLDNYPQDTSWNIVDSTGEVVAKSPTYDESMAGSTEIESLCLLADSYSFDIYDDYEDGICCEWGNGSYTLTSADGEVLVTGGEWVGPSETKTFQLP